jgi:hypothetical protein
MRCLMSSLWLPRFTGGEADEVFDLLRRNKFLKNDENCHNLTKIAQNCYTLPNIAQKLPGIAQKRKG